MATAPFVLLVNPWITDFAAHDLWAKPMGLLLLGALLREGGCGVALIDCLDRHDAAVNRHPSIMRGDERRYGTGKFPKVPIDTPSVFETVPRTYYRYGIHPQRFREKLESLPTPDLIWVTSIMTYWYPGTQQAISILRDVFPKSPVWLGGIYAQLCTTHARENSGASEVLTIPAGTLPSLLEARTGYTLKNKGHWASFCCWPPPALDLLSKPTYAPLLTSRGCPFHCPYCASGLLQPGWERRSSEEVYGEITRWQSTFGIGDFAFYDDALLVDAESTLRPLLERVYRDKLHVRFHTPNALHICALTQDWCDLLFASGFKTIRLGLETTRRDRQREWGGKVETGMFYKAVENLESAGFSGTQIGAYLLCGLPGQKPDEVEDAIRTVRHCGVQPYLAEYSPIPGTRTWPHSLVTSPFDIESEPLYHNNTFFACRRPDFTYEDLLSLKELARQVRRDVARSAGAK